MNVERKEEAMKPSYRNFQHYLDEGWHQKPKKYLPGP